MKKTILNLGLLTAAAACSLTASAVPAKPGILTVETADGSELRVRLVGDESYHRYFTEDGYPLVQKDGNFYYCDVNNAGEVLNSGIKAGNAELRGAAAKSFLAKIDMAGLESRMRKLAEKAPRRNMVSGALPASYKAPAKEADGNDGPPYDRGPGLFPDQRFPAYGDQKAIVILVEYTDVKFNTNYDAHDYFTRMLNQDDFNDYGGTGCAAQFFRENSGDSFRPEFDVYGPITLAHNMAYYGGNGWSGDDQNPGAMVKEACDQLDDIVDFNDYDRNHDGVVDNIFVFYAGRGEASGGSADTVWPHSWNMESAGFPNLYYDGVKVYTYGCSNEWEGSRPDGVGTFVHEFSHVMGLPDLYATSYTSAFTPGSWSALDYGPYNNSGMTPPNYGAFERYALGWLKPREIDRELSCVLQPVSENVCGIIRTSDPEEFFLVENRQQEGWDAYIPGHGMLIWHVDYDSYIWTRNTVNNSASHQYVDIEEADGSQSEYTRSGDSFPGTANKTSFTASTSPAMKTWNGTAINYPITDIVESNGLITFNVLGGSTETVPAVTVNEPQDVTAEGFTISWEPVEGYDAVVNIYTRPDAAQSGALRLQGNEVFLPGYRNRNVGEVSSIVVTNAEPETTYYYTVALTSGWQVSEPSEEKSVETGRLDISYHAVEAVEAANVESDSFVANWLALEDADAYFVSVFTKAEGDPYMDVCDFTDGVDKIGGWSTSSSMSYSGPSNCGEATPSLRLAPGNHLTSPGYADGVNGLSFWHRGVNTSTGDYVYVYAEVDGTMQLLETVEIQKAVGGATTTVENIPADAKRVRLVFVRNSEKGAVAIDDVKVFHGHEYTNVPLEGYTDLPAGNELSFAVTGLAPDTEYFYTVRAKDGDIFSRPSNEVRVQTKSASGVTNVADAASFAVTVAGLEISCTSADEIVVADYTGALVGRGSHKVTLPRAGLYVVTVPAKGYAKKIIVR